jgi:hypothetical protein
VITRQGSPYVWVPEAARYRDGATGRFVKPEVVRLWAQDSVTAAQDVVGGASNKVGNGVIPPESWYDTMRSEIKNQYITQYLTGIGGRNNMTQADWGRIGGMIADQYRYLERFYAEVQTGELSAEEIDRRARMYINSAREALSRSNRESHKIAGYTKKHWVLGPTENHCKNCPAFDALGWVDIDYRYEVDGREAIPGNGATECLTSCQCHEEFRK